ncbi:hypothetical protein RIF29_38019 [Crotalaria pallida]|uniref:Uncharacterized protein n=1 Tax=Crotalaria pallida TaxID=3830 RepID=A0AAN9HRY1_CROPI
MSPHIPPSIITLTLILFLFLFSISIAAASASASASSNLTIYDHLRQQGLPVGLLPKGITRYSLNTATGEFLVSMEQPCDAKFENQVHYDSNITGTLGYGSIAGLSGVTAQELFLWFPVKGIRVDVPSSGLIHFDVGVADKQFSLSLFEDPPRCTAVSLNRLQSQFQFQAHVDGEDVLRATS